MLLSFRSATAFVAVSRATFLHNHEPREVAGLGVTPSVSPAGHIDVSNVVVGRSKGLEWPLSFRALLLRNIISIAVLCWTDVSV